MKYAEEQKGLNLAYYLAGLMTEEEMIKENKELDLIDTNTEFGLVSPEEQKGEVIL